MSANACSSASAITSDSGKKPVTIVYVSQNMHQPQFSCVWIRAGVNMFAIWMVSLDRLEQLIRFKRKKENMTYDMHVNTQWHSGVVLSPWKRALEPQRDNVGCEGVYLSTNCFYNPLMQWSLEQLNDCPVLNSQGRMRCEPWQPCHTSNVRFREAQIDLWRP